MSRILLAASIALAI